MLVSCGKDKNPILGEWEVEASSKSFGVNAVLGVAQMFKTPFVRFTETEIIFNIIGDSTQSQPITYRREDDGSWFFCTEKGRFCEKFVFTDKERNQAAISLLGLDLNLKRVVPPED
jgi:hypothetical protein